MKNQDYFSSLDDLIIISTETQVPIYLATFFYKCNREMLDKLSSYLVPINELCIKLIELGKIS